MIFSLSIFGSNIDSLKTSESFNLTKNEFKYKFVNMKLKSTTSPHNKDIKLKTAALVGYPVFMSVMIIGYSSSATDSKTMQTGIFVGSTIAITALFIYVVASN
jgi:hypothetical protein